MSYIRNQLNPGESLVATAHYHWANFVGGIIYLAIVAGVVLLALEFLPDKSLDDFMHYIPNNYDELRTLLHTNNDSILFYITLYLFLLIAVLSTVFNIFRTSINLFATPLALTNLRIIGKAGIITRNALDTPLNKIDTIRVTKGTIGLLFNYGKIHILTPTGKFVYKGIANPEDFKQKIFVEINRP